MLLIIASVAVILFVCQAQVDIWESSTSNVKAIKLAFVVLAILYLLFARFS